MSSREWRHRIEDILDAITEIQSFVAGATLEQFTSDAKTLKAVAADLMIIGEAANHVPDDVQDAHPDVPWLVMRALRNRVVHVYFDIDPAILWDTVQHDLPKLVDAQQIIFSHRVYAAQGPSHQQLWIWSADTGTLTQISHAERDHRFPTCDSDGRHIVFDDEENGLKTTGWRLDRTTGTEEPLNSPRVNLAHEASPSPAPTQCDVGTAHVSPDGARVACAVKGTDILIADARTLADIARVPFGQHYSTGDPYAPWPMASLWSPDGRTLLVGTYGENGGSTTGELDYFLLDLATRTWTRAFTGTDALWLTPTLIVYVTPRDLSPLPGGGARTVWTAHLTAFDPVAHRARPITSGVSNDLSPAVCPR